MATLLTVALVTPVFALVTKRIEVETGVKVYVDDHPVQVEDAYGDPMEAIIWNGRTYLPVKAVTDAMKIPLKWEGKTFSVYVGKHSSDSPTVWLQNLDYFYHSGSVFENVNGEGLKDNLGNFHKNVIASSLGYSMNVYKLNGRYNAISGILYQKYNDRSVKSPTVLNIYGDGELLYSASVEGGVEPIPFKVDLTGVLELKVEIDSSVWGGGAVGEFGLWT